MPIRHRLPLLAAITSALIAAGTAARAQNVARGVVFEDSNGNGKLNAGEPPIPGVGVSSETEVVLTGADGRYELTIDDDSFVFVVKPTGYMVALGNHSLAKHDGDDYSFTYKAAGFDRDRQMRIYPPGRHRSGDKADSKILLNVFDGMERATVEFSINDGEFQPMQFAPQEEPLAQSYYSGPVPLGKSWVRPLVSHHIWEAPLERASLPAGPSLARVRYRDELGREFVQTSIFRK